MYSMPASTELVKCGRIKPLSYSYMGNGHCGGGTLKSAIVRLLVLFEAWAEELYSALTSAIRTRYMAKDMDHVLLETIFAIIALALVLTETKPRWLYNLHNIYLVARYSNHVGSHWAYHLWLAEIWLVCMIGELDIAVLAKRRIGFHNQILWSYWPES